jgi:hypothetical protein
MRPTKRVVVSVMVMIAALAITAVPAMGSSPGVDRRLSNDYPGGGYVSAYTLATGQPYTDATLAECSRSRGRQNEPSVGVDPRNDDVLVGSSNDYCGVYNDGVDADGAPIPSGPIWLGYYRSENQGATFQSSLVPGYPDDTSPYRALARVRTASSGDPVIAWDTHGRVFMGSESSDDPAGTAKTFGDVWVARYDNPGGEAGNTLNDGKRFRGSVVVARGSAAPNLLGKFNDKTALEVDRTGGRCDGNVYFSWSRFTGGATNGYNSSVQFARSTNHGATFSTPQVLSTTIHDIQFPDIAVTGNGHVYITFRQFGSVLGQQFTNAVWYVKSTDCGRTFSRPRRVATFEPYDAADISAPEGIPAPTKPAREPAGEEGSGAPAGARTGQCGDFALHCESGYTFFRRNTQVRSTADQLDQAHEWVYIVYDPSKPGTEVATGTTYGSVVSGDLPTKYHKKTGSQSAIYFTRLDGATGAHTAPTLLDSEASGHQLFPDISADGGVLHALWWDSRNDACYSPARPVGNCADLTTVPSLDVFATRSTDRGATWTTAQRVTDFTSNPNYEQFSGRLSPFAGDYLWISSVGDFAYGTWTDYRDTVAGVDQREGTDADHDNADVLQCRTFTGGSTGHWTGDTCPRDGGLDQNIYGDTVP